MASFDFEGHITDIVDYPKPGVVFKDITTLLKDPDGFAATIDAIADHFAEAGVTKVVGAEARGFMIGAPVAYRLHAGFVPARKPGKLPREVRSASYELEYGTDELQIHVDAIGPDDVVLSWTTCCHGRHRRACGSSSSSVRKVAGLGFAYGTGVPEPTRKPSPRLRTQVFSLVKVN